MHERDEWAAEIRQIPAAAVHDRTCSDDYAAMRSNNINCLLHTATTRHDVLGHDESLSRLDLETSHHETALAVLLDEDVTRIQMARDLLADHDATDRGRNDRVVLVAAQFVGKQAAHMRGDARMLEQDRALEKLTAVQATAKNKMAVQQCAGLAEEIEDFGHSREIGHSLRLQNLKSTAPLLEVKLTTVVVFLLREIGGGAPVRAMKRIETDELLAALKWRYAAKKFDPARKIDDATWAALEEVLVLSPSSFGLQPWKFLVIKDPAVRESLVPLSWGQRQVADASHLVIFTVKHPLDTADVRRHIERTAEVQGIAPDVLAGFEKVVNDFIGRPFDVRSWSTRQVYIALGNFLTAAALLGIDTCPMEGLDPAAYDKALGLEGTGYYTVAACPAGFRAADDHSAARAKVRFKPEHIIEHR